METQVKELTGEEMQNVSGGSSILGYIGRAVLEAIADYIDGLGRPTV